MATLLELIARRDVLQAEINQLHAQIREMREAEKNAKRRPKPTITEAEAQRLYDELGSIAAVARHLGVAFGQLDRYPLTKERRERYARWDAEDIKIFGYPLPR